MPGIQSQKFDSGRLLLTASIAAASAPAVGQVEVDNIRALGGALAGSNGFASSPQLQETLQKNPQWNALPSYKIEELSSTPYTFTDRAYEALSREVLPLASIFALHTAASTAGLEFHRLWRTDADKVSEYAWRLGEAIGDFASSETTTELMWRLLSTNIDFFTSTDFVENYTGATAFRMLRRALAYSYGFSYALPEALHQHVFNAIGYAGIAFETPALNEHFAFTFISSSTGKDPGSPNSAYLDLDFVHRAKPFDDPQSRFERALVALDKASRENNVTRVRFYPTVVGDQRKDSALELFVRFYVDNRPGPLIRFPASFGSSSTRIWWTDAVDRQIFERVYNDRDQYAVVAVYNKMMDYKNSVITPISDAILEKIPAIMSWAAREPVAGDYGAIFEQQINNAIEADTVGAESSDDDLNLGQPAKPRQSMHHSVMKNGDDSYMWVDGYHSQGAELPIFVMMSRNSADNIQVDDLVKLEKHLPWNTYRGSYKMASTLAKSKAYSMIVQRLMMSRSEQFKAQRRLAEHHIKLVPEHWTSGDVDIFNEYTDLALDGRTLDQALEDTKKSLEGTPEFQEWKKKKDIIDAKRNRQTSEKVFEDLKENLKAAQEEVSAAGEELTRAIGKAKTPILKTLRDRVAATHVEHEEDHETKQQRAVSELDDYLKANELDEIEGLKGKLEKDYLVGNELKNVQYAQKERIKEYDSARKAIDNLQADIAKHIAEHKALGKYIVIEKVAELVKQVEPHMDAEKQKRFDETFAELRQAGGTVYPEPTGLFHELKSFGRNLLGSIPGLDHKFGPKAQEKATHDAREQRAKDRVTEEKKRADDDKTERKRLEAEAKRKRLAGADAEAERKRFLETSVMGKHQAETIKPKLKEPDTEAVIPESEEEGDEEASIINQALSKKTTQQAAQISEPPSSSTPPSVEFTEEHGVPTEEHGVPTEEPGVSDEKPKDTDTP
ncbi:hypothetical protein [Sansalvadorimonas verongulae]|uniref:hypothetical protein n=1 Tax=Sansalvadorimonas verongulae TaxID=2172824 RepID=UPI0012BD678B|nr:hypothetical protein [Sansalvadorimonas verongulae]MTI13946.1 hypothetical protein [Sansalvadorimonas verongulae]